MSKYEYPKQNLLEFGNWNFGIIWDLEIGIWDLRKTHNIYRCQF
jgi:hypothetical protein